MTAHVEEEEVGGASRAFEENGIKGEGARGKTTDYHNRAADLAKAGDEKAAFTEVFEGLRYYPYNIDLLADALLFSNGRNCDAYLARLKEIGIKRWGWRPFYFSIEYLIDNVADADPSPERREEALDEAVSLADAFIRQLPWDERAYNTKVKALQARMRRGDLEEAEGIFQKIIEGEVPGVSKGGSIPLAQCCVRYGDMLMEQGRYSEVPRVMRIGIAGSAQEQPSANTGYFFYLKALAEDAMLHIDCLDLEEL